MSEQGRVSVDTWETLPPSGRVLTWGVGETSPKTLQRPRGVWDGRIDAGGLARSRNGATPRRPVAPRRVVTGGSGGIGRATAERLAPDGVAVGVHYAGNRARAEETVARITAAGGRAKAVGGDVADEREMAEVFDDIERAFGGIDVVAHAAGIMVLNPVVDYDLGEFDRVIRTNLRGTFVVDQLAARWVRQGGAIVNISTSVTRLRQPTYGVYAATKGAAQPMTLVLARELRGRDVTVNAVAPGPTATPFFLDGKSQESIDSNANANPMQRLVEPEDIAEVVSFLAWPGRWVNGQTIYANGGAI